MQLRKKTLTYVAYHSMILYLRSHLSSHQYCRELTVPLNTRTQNVILFFFSLTISLQPYKRQPLRNFVKIICNHEIYNHCRLFFQIVCKHAIYNQFDIPSNNFQACNLHPLRNFNNNLQACNLWWIRHSSKQLASIQSTTIEGLVSRDEINFHKYVYTLIEIVKLEFLEHHESY